MNRADVVSDFEEAFASLTSRDGEWIPARGVGRDAWLGRDPSGMPVVLLPFVKGADALPPFELAHIRVNFGRVVDFETPDRDRRRERFAVIECLRAPVDLQRYFLMSAQTLLRSLPDPITAPELNAGVMQLVELFSALDAPPRSAVDGVWGELFLLAYATDSRTLADAWHNTSDERFDFALGMERLEVKTTRSELRAHHFSLEQLSTEDLDVTVASLVVSPAGGGVSVRDLFRRLSDRVPSSRMLKLESQVATQLGREWRTFELARFDVELARKSLRLLAASEIPQVSRPLPDGVTHVSFVADCSRVRVRASAELDGVLLRAAALT